MSAIFMYPVYQSLLVATKNTFSLLKLTRRQLVAQISLLQSHLQLSESLPYNYWLAGCFNTRRKYIEGPAAVKLCRAWKYFLPHSVQLGNFSPSWNLAILQVGPRSGMILQWGPATRPPTHPTTALVENPANLQDCKISRRVKFPSWTRVWQ